MTRLIQDKSTQRHWRLPYVPFSEGGTENQSAAPTLRASTPKSLSTTKSVFRAPSTFWQGSFVQGQGRSTIQLQSPMVYTTPSLIQRGILDVVAQRNPQNRQNLVQLSNPLQNRMFGGFRSRYWMSMFHLYKINAPHRNVRLWKRNVLCFSNVVQYPVCHGVKSPTFPDPFIAQRQSITLQQSAVNKSVTPHMSASAPESLLSQPNLKTAQNDPVVQRKPADSKWSGCSQEKRKSR